MEQTAFEKFNKLSDKHLALMEAFEYYEKMHKGVDTVEEASSGYRGLLQFWRNYLGVSFCSHVKEENLHDEIQLVPQLELINEELLKTYSPVEMQTETIEEKYTLLRGYLSSMSDDTILAQKATFLLCRLLYNILLIRDCYYPIYSLPYTDFLNNLKNRLNLCIIVSQLDFFSEYFEEIIGDFNEDFISVKEVTPHILSIVGGLNFKCHKYAEAINFFKKSIISYEDSTPINMASNDEYFATKLLLAYCYEYNHEFESSIQELIGVDVSNLFPLCGKLRIYNLMEESGYKEGEKSAQQIVKSIKSLSENASNNNLLALGLQRDHEIDTSVKIGDAHEVLHSLAHCLNELGIKNKTEGKRDNVVKLLFLSRMIMLLVAEQNNECEDFQTCLYMIYGEAKDYDICLERIREITKKLNVRPYNNVNYYMENTFYKFLVLNQSNKVISEECASEAENAYIEFKKFARRRYDYDALIHIEIIKFRASIINILRKQPDAALQLKYLIKLKETDEGKNMFGIIPSAKLNKWIVQEYNKTIALYEFLIKYFESSGFDINALYNYACRFTFFRNQFEENVHPFSDTISKEEAIHQTLELIIEDVLSPQSIFLLAPLTSAVPYQHQTRSLLSLEKNLFLDNYDSIMLSGQLENKIGSFQKLAEIPEPSQKAVFLSDWLFSHEEYRTLFLISINTPEQYCDRFFYKDSSGVSLERPIHNVQNVNYLLNAIANKRRRKRHSFCKNYQAACCITVVEEKSKDLIDNSYRNVNSWIKNICADLLLPANVYENAHFIIDYRIAGRNVDWVIIGFEEVLSKVHESEIVSRLCGKGDKAPPEYKLAVSLNKFCFVGFDPLSARFATTDLLYLQNRGFHFWFRQNPSDNEEEMLVKANHALFYISPSIVNNNAQSIRIIRLIKYAREIPIDSTNISIIVTGYSTKASVRKALIAANIDELLVNNYILKSVVFRNAQINYDKHLEQIGQVLINNGVGKNAFS